MFGCEAADFPRAGKTVGTVRGEVLRDSAFTKEARVVPDITFDWATLKPQELPQLLVRLFGGP